MANLVPFKGGGATHLETQTRRSILLPAVSDDVRSSDDVIAFEGGYTHL